MSQNNLSYSTLHCFRASKPSVAQLAWPLTSRSRLATGRPRSETATPSRERRRWSRCSTPRSPSARRTTLPAVTATASSAASSVTAPKTAATVQTKTLAVIDCCFSDDLSKPKVHRFCTLQQYTRESWVIPDLLRHLWAVDTFLTKKFLTMQALPRWPYLGDLYFFARDQLKSSSFSLNQAHD